MNVTRPVVLLILGVPGLTACGAGYLLQAARGQAAVLAARQPIAHLIADPATDAGLRAQLQLASDARAFASSALGLPDNGSYRSYVDLRRPFIVWTVVAAPEFSVRAREWCFPVTGCVAYRGYFKEAAARAYAARLAAAGMDTMVAGVTAYSTLGRFDDPLLSTMLRFGVTEVAATIFHELAHHVIYVPGDSAFNEAFAVTVEQAGIVRWLIARGQSLELQEWRERRALQVQFVARVASTRRELDALYRAEPREPERRAGKRALLQALERDLRSLAAGNEQRAASLDAWIGAGLNNAHLASIATYWNCVPAFERELAAIDADLPRFYAAVKRLAKLPATDREARLCGTVTGLGRAATARAPE